MKPYKIIDAHCDTIGKMLDENEAISKNCCHYSLENIACFTGYVQFFAAWVGKEEKKPFLRAVHMLENAKRQISMHHDKIEEIRTAQELEQVFAQKKHGAIFALEDGRSLEGEIENLYHFYDLGVRAITLAWNDDNDLTGGIGFNKTGLTEFGKAVILEMNRLGMMVDVSHISEQGFWDVLECSKKPVMASHSNCRALCSHMRNIDDSQIKALIKQKGFIGINLYCDFLTDKGDTGIDHVFRHIEHILSLGGENIVGFGSDFDGMTQLPKKIRHAGDYIVLLEYMAKNGYKDCLIDKICHGNMLNFIKRVEK